MSPVDEEHTAFYTDNGVCCYKVMPFGLKNAGATYQRLVNRMFEDQLGRNVEAYVDDMIVKSRHAKSHCADLTETFATLRKYQMKLNPEKCAFGVESGKFLGFIITHRGIEANPEKSSSHPRYGLAKDSPQSPETDRTTCRAKPLLGEIRRQMSFFFPSSERREEFHVDRRV